MLPASQVLLALAMILVQGPPSPPVDSAGWGFSIEHVRAHHPAGLRAPIDLHDAFPGTGALFLTAARRFSRGRELTAEFPFAVVMGYHSPCADASCREFVAAVAHGNPYLRLSQRLGRAVAAAFGIHVPLQRVRRRRPATDDFYDPFLADAGLRAGWADRMASFLPGVIAATADLDLQRELGRGLSIRATGSAQVLHDLQPDRRTDDLVFVGSLDPYVLVATELEYGSGRGLRVGASGTLKDRLKSPGPIFYQLGAAVSYPIGHVTPALRLLVPGREVMMRGVQGSEPLKEGIFSWWKLSVNIQFRPRANIP